MKIKLTENQKIKGKLRKPGETVIVNKLEGERLISEGVANRLISGTENRIVDSPENRGARRFTGHKVFGRNP